mgnify:CR=1 FL=1
MFVIPMILSDLCSNKGTVRRTMNDLATLDVHLPSDPLPLVPADAGYLCKYLLRYVNIYQRLMRIFMQRSHG